MSKIILETKRLILREYIEKDYNDLCEILQDKEVMLYYEHSFSDEEVKSWVNRLMTEHYKKHGFGLWIIENKDNGAVLGQCGLTVQELDDKEYLEIGYLFKKRHWHNGYAVEAATACKNYAFEYLKAEKVCSIIRATNTASQNVVLRIGMKKTKEIIKRYYNMDMLHYIYEVGKNEFYRF